MKIRRLHVAAGLSAAALMATAAPISAMAQGYGGGYNQGQNYNQGYNNAPPRPQPFNQPPPNLDDYLSRARQQYSSDNASWQANRDAANRAIADWDARYSRPPPPPPRVLTPVPTGPAPASVSCQKRDNNTITGGLLGALVGAALGSNIAAKNTRTEGAVLGGVAGAALGATIARTNTSCDDQGYYWSYDQTYAYQEPTTYKGRNSGAHNYDYYVREKCRLALAPDSGNDYRYVRVCPDGQNRYRITD